MMKLYVLDGGTLGPYDKSPFFCGRDRGTKIILPVWQAYIDHPKAKIIVDTGINPKTDMLPGLGRIVNRNPDQHIEEQLARVGASPDEIDIVINTHLHYDHTAYNRLFEKATIIVQKAEMRHAFVPEKFMWEYYQPRSHFDVPDLNYELIEGDYEVAEGVHILSTPGHSAGHQSVLVETEKPGPIIIAGDAVYFKESLEQFVVPYIVYDPTQCLASQKRIARIAQKKGARVLPSHDASFFETLKKAPSCYG